MRIGNRCASALFKACVALGSLTGIAIQCGLFRGEPDFSAMRYFTLLSNLLTAAYFCAAAPLALRGKPFLSANRKGALTMGITVTGLVYHLMLSNGHFSMGSAADAANHLLHTFTPILTVLDWLLFDEKGRYDRLSPVKWTALPDIYFALATLYGFTSGGRFYGGSRFPYYFMDYDALGVGGVLLNVVMLNAAFIALGYGFLLIDWLLARAGEKRGKGADVKG